MNVIWKTIKACLLVSLFLISSTSVNGQMKAIYFNAEWNSANNIEWFSELSDVKKQTMDIGEGDCQEKYQIAIVPTIVLFKDGEEVKRFQADLSFKMVATRKEIQNAIDELLMSDF
tara:strand:- start:163 stop:510 length:348 start_codon:yes stop_codon:yes gene_type:complete